MSQSSQCMECKHYTGAHLCAAYPDGIPVVIMTGEVAHDKPYKNDGGIQFEKADEFKNIDDAFDE